MNIAPGISAIAEMAKRMHFSPGTVAGGSIASKTHHERGTCVCGNATHVSSKPKRGSGAASNRGNHQWQ